MVRTLLLSAIIAVMVLFLSACSGVPRQIREVAVDVPFETLAQNTDRYASRTVILGGYIEQIQVAGSTTRFVVLQAPLGLFDQPKSKRTSEGRFLAEHDGLLGEAGYNVGQEVTIVGTVLGRQVPDFGNYADEMIAVETLRIYRWHYDREDAYCDSPVNGESFPHFKTAD